MYGIKTPTYKGTNLKISQKKSSVHSSDFKLTKSDTRLYIANSISEDVTHGISALMTSMTKDILEDGISLWR